MPTDLLLTILPCPAGSRTVFGFSILPTATLPPKTSLDTPLSLMPTRKCVPRTPAMASGDRTSKRPLLDSSGVTLDSTRPCTSVTSVRGLPVYFAILNLLSLTWLLEGMEMRVLSGNASDRKPFLPVLIWLPSASMAPIARMDSEPSALFAVGCPASATTLALLISSGSNSSGTRMAEPIGMVRSLLILLRLPMMLQLPSLPVKRIAMADRVSPCNA